MPLLLGPVLFQDFEIPQSLTFGGAQRLAIHRLPGGARVIDVMGRDDADITWSGICSGPDAAARIAALDLVRATGATLPLAWDVFLYTVIVSQLVADYTSPWWIPFQITCTVVQDEAQLIAGVLTDLIGSVTGDLTAAAAGANVAAPLAALAIAGAGTAGTAANAAAVGSIAACQTTLAGNFAAANANLGAGDFPTILAASGQAAQLADAQGYLSRAAVNLGNAST